MKWILLLLFGGLGLGALISGAMWGAKRLPLFQSGLRAQGKVVAQEEKVSLETIGRKHSYSEKVISYYPVVEFLTGTGEKVRFTGSSGGKGKPIIETGSEVEVLYDTADPNKARISDFSQFWLGPLVVTVCGLIFLLMGVGGFFMMGSHDRIMDERFEMMNRSQLIMNSEAQIIQGVIEKVEERPEKSGKYVFICKAHRFGGRGDEEFVSDYFGFDPGHNFIGRTVDIYLDPADPAVYYVKLDPLLPEILRRQKNR